MITSFIDGKGLTMKLQINQNELIQYCFEDKYDKDILCSEVIESLTATGTYSLDIEDMLGNLGYLPSYCIDNWDELVETKVIHLDEIEDYGLQDWSGFEIEYV